MKKLKTFILVALAIVIWVSLLFKPKLHITDYSEYVVSPKESLWSIADKVYDDSVDIRRAIYDIEQKNEIENAIIHTGQILLLPNYERK